MNPESTIVADLYKTNYAITDDQLLAGIIDHPELSTEDLWLLPQYPFDEWRKKYDYPRIIENLKKNTERFEEWMKNQGLTEEMLTGGYISSFLHFRHKDDKDNKEKKTKAEKERIKLQAKYYKEGHFHLIEVTYKGKTKYQVWYSYDGIKESGNDDNKVVYQYVKPFISYSDWCLLHGITNEIIPRLDRVYQNSQDEQVYLNGNLNLLKMGGIQPPVNSVGILLRGKTLEFVNVSGLILNDTIYFGSMGNLEFKYCAVDNLKCNELDMPHLSFHDCSVRNLQINNSELQSWKFINSQTSGKISNSILEYFRVWGGLFNPVFENTEPHQFGVWHKPMNHSPNFDRTYRALYKGCSDIGNYKEASKFKLAELDFIRGQKSGWQKFIWTIDKYFWGYGKEPYKVIVFAIITIMVFGFLYSLFPHLILPQKPLESNLPEPAYWEKLGNSMYCSVCTYITLGYSDVSPKGLMKMAASLEAITGAISMGFLVVSLTKTKD